MSSFIEEIAGGKLPSVNKKSILVVGGLGVAGVVLFQLLNKGQASSVENSDPVVVTDRGMPTNSADVQAQLQNFASMTEDYVDQTLNQALTAIAAENTQANNSLTSDLNKAMTEIFNSNQKYQDSLLNTVNQELETIVKETDSRFEEFEKPVSAPPPVVAPKPTPTPTPAKPAPKPATPAKPAPKPVAPVSTSKSYTVRKGDTLSEILGTNDRSVWNKVAAANGIKDVNKIQTGQVIKIPK